MRAFFAATASIIDTLLFGFTGSKAASQEFGTWMDMVEGTVAALPYVVGLHTHASGESCTA